MSNVDKYNNAFIEALELDEGAEIESLEYQSIETWDSMGHMGLIAELEDAFDIVMDTDDIIDFSSYKKGQEILSNNYGISF